MKRGRLRSAIPLGFSKLEDWPCPDLVQGLDENFSKRKIAVEMYAAGAEFSDILQSTGKDRKEVRRLVERCTTSNGMGGIHGFSALINGFRVVDYVRSAEVISKIPGEQGGYSGALEKIFKQYPELDLKLQKYFLKSKLDKNSMPLSRVRIVDVHVLFKKELRSRGFTDEQWPFNTLHCGKQSIWKYCNKLLNNIISEGAVSQFGQDAARRGLIGKGVRPLITHHRPFSFVELDFHKIDSASIIILKNEFGEELEVPVARWHIGFLVEVGSGSVLGVHVSLEKTPSGDDVLEVVENALDPEKLDENDPRQVFVSDGEVVISQLMPELRYQCFSVIKFDNGWSNSAHEVVANIMDTVGCAANFGPVKHWWRRQLIEKIFGQITRSGLQRTASTHGSGPKDSRINDPNNQAIKYRILISDLISIIYCCVRDYNCEATERLQFTSPVDYLKFALLNENSGFFLQPLPFETIKKNCLLWHVEEVTVCGSRKKHERPYFKSDRCRYTNIELANSPWLIGKKLIIYVNRRECRIVYATVKETGLNLGLMNPERKWANSKCSYRDRKIINRSGTAKKDASAVDDVMVSFIEKKSKELWARKKKQQKNSSGAALHMAKMRESSNKTIKPEHPSTVNVGVKNTSSDGLPSQRSIADDVGVAISADPLGFQIIPTMKPVKKR